MATLYLPLSLVECFAFSVLLRLVAALVRSFGRTAIRDDGRCFVVTWLRLEDVDAV